MQWDTGRLRRGAIFALAILLPGIHTAQAQYVISARAGTIHYVTGHVTVGGQPIILAPVRFPMLQQGEVLRTGDGLAEVLLGPGVFLRLAEHGAMRMLETRLEDTEVEVIQGTALVEVVEMPKGSDIHVVAGSARTGFRGMGLYRFETGSNELRVFGGRAEVSAGEQKVDAGRGRVVRFGAKLILSRFDPHRTDTLHEWAAGRSFLLYVSSLESRARQTNWVITRITPGNNWLGLPTDRDQMYVSNPDFGVMFHSPPLPLRAQERD